MTSDTDGIVVGRSTVADVAAWNELASEVENEFGARLVGTEDWSTRLRNHINSGSAWCARPGVEGAMIGGMWLSDHGSSTVTLSWLAVRRAHRRRGIGRALVGAALVEADGRSVRVVTFGPDHPLVAAARAARALYVNLGFEPTAEIVPVGPDGTPRSVWQYHR